MSGRDQSSIKIVGAAIAKKDLEDWGWGEAPEELFNKICIQGASVVIDQMIEQLEDLHFLIHWPELTFWPIGGDNPYFTFDLRKILNQEIEEIETDIAAPSTAFLYDHDSSHYRKIAKEFFDLANRYQAVATKAKEKEDADASIPVRHD